MGGIFLYGGTAVGRSIDTVSLPEPLGGDIQLNQNEVFKAKTLEAAWQRYKDREVVFLGIEIQDTEQAARAFLKEFWITYVNARDESGEVAIEYGVWGIPETFFIDREGRITYKQVGALGWPIITAKLDEALRGIVSAEEGRGDYRPIR